MIVFTTSRDAAMNKYTKLCFFLMTFEKTSSDEILCLGDLRIQRGYNEVKFICYLEVDQNLRNQILLIGNSDDISDEIYDLW